MQHKKRILFGLLTAFWCYVIFSFSHSTGESSGGLSLKITQYIIHMIYPSFQNLATSLQIEILDLCHLVIRKGAHMTEYAILYLLSYQFVSTYNISFKKMLTYPLIFSVIYAFLDEFHQLFIDGRAGKLIDVGIDSCGILIMMALIYLIKKCFLKNKTMV